MPRNRWVRRIAIGLAAGLVLTVATAAYFRHSTRRSGMERLDAVSARLDVTDPCWRLDEIEADRGWLPDDQNGALLVPNVHRRRFPAWLA